MVGDPKQAIYRFRRTDARLFDIARQYFVRHFAATACALNRTRRNAPPIVGLVNALFGTEPLFSGFQAHIADHPELAGGVCVLPAFAALDRNATEVSGELRDPLEAARADDVEDRFAAEARALVKAIRATVGRVMVQDKEGVERPARWRDIMLLFRRRSPLAAFEHALRAARIPYVGARPGGLLAALEVGDMVALLAFLAAPEEDLMLAQVLKSPLFALGDDVLLAIRFDARPGAWWPRLKALAAAADADPGLQRAARLLGGWQAWMDRLPVHDLLDRIFHEAGVLSAYATAVPDFLRAGVIANLNAFMALALEVDSGRYPSLMRFLQELKRFSDLPDQEAPDEGQAREPSADSGAEAETDALRLMTIHSAKGLEAPIVWLIDADDQAGRAESHGVLSDWPAEEPAPRHFSFLSTKALQGHRRDAILAEEAAYREREQLNLLYVAATRARQYLIISGSTPSRPPSAPSWLQRALAAATPLLGEFPGALARARPPEFATDAVSAAALVPSPLEPVGTRIAPAHEDEAERLLGIAVHALLEIHSPVSGQAVQALPPGMEGEAADIARRILQAPALASFFVPDRFVAAHNEVEITVVADGLARLQRIDRLVLLEGEAWVLDYKTGAVDVEQHRLQIDAYCDAVMAIYPGKTLRGAVIDRDGALWVLR
jgi:ATP-dependent helicase/nuclease subunit A